jgi:Bacterial capsule synthesis protein PGA_cap
LRRKEQPTTGSFKKSDSELRFQLPQIITDRRLSFVQNQRGLAQRVTAAHGEEGREIAQVGDTILTRTPNPRGSCPGIRGLLESADVRFTNLETPFNDYAGSPDANEIIHLSASPEMAYLVAKSGFNLCSAANNHALDYGTEGLSRSISALKAANVRFAGIGHDLWEASGPVYLDVAGCRFGLIACTSTLERGWQAADQALGVDSRPGVNPLRFTQVFTLTREHFDGLVSLAHALSFDRVEDWHVWMGHRPPLEDPQNELRFLDQAFRLGPSNQTLTQANSADCERLLGRTREASQLTDYVVISIHSHEFEQELEKPPQFLIDIARKCIQAGAHAVAVTGPHLLRGAELFEGGIIFYSLGNFFFQYETMERVPAEGYANAGLDPSTSHLGEFMEKAIPGLRADPRYWESVVPVCIFRQGRLAQVEIHPIDISKPSSKSQRGTPYLAANDRGKEILERFNELCLPFGTRFKINHGSGVWNTEEG